MIVHHTDRGFRIVYQRAYLTSRCDERLIQESSSIGDYDDSVEKPGSSFLWVGANKHLNREEVAELVKLMQGWLDTGRIPMDSPAGGPRDGAAGEPHQ
jgi:hypothetical protein